LLEAQQPEVEEELCVHSKLATANCTACVDVCPKQAWVLDDSQLGLNTASCDGCGLCVPVCPEAAIGRMYQPARYNWKGHDVVFVGCEKAGLLESEGVVPCVHGVGIRDLLLLYRQGIKDIMITRGDCTKCDRGSASMLDEALMGLNLILMDRSIHPIQCFEIEPEKWTYNLKQVMKLPMGQKMGRRLFLRRAVDIAVSDRLVGDTLTGDKELWSTPIGQLAPQVQHNAILPFTPMIEESSCNGCDVCVRLCPHNAITLVKNTV